MAYTAEERAFYADICRNVSTAKRTARTIAISNSYRFRRLEARRKAYVKPLRTAPTTTSDGQPTSTPPHNNHRV